MRRLLRRLLPQLPGGGHHAGQRANDFGPLAGFQAAVRIDPQALFRDAPGDLAQALHDLLLRGQVGRVDVIHARADVVGVVEVHEGIKQLHAGARGFDGDHVGIHLRNGGDDVVELRIAHVGVDLRFVAHATGGDAKARNRPVQIRLPLLAAQRQALAQGGFVDLDHADARFFQIKRFGANGQRQLAAGKRARLVVAHEGPIEHGDGAGEHAFDGARRERLRPGGPVHRHGARAANVAKDDGRLDAARAVGLHPAKAREGVALQQLAEVFDHVVALGFAVHEHIQPQRFLLADGALDFGAHGLAVAVFVEPARLVFAAGVAHLRGLREGADGGGRPRGQLQPRGLPGRALGKGAGALLQFGRDAAHGLLHIGHMHARRGAAGGQRGLVGQQLLLHGGAPFAQGAAQHLQLFKLLQGEGQPRAHVVIEPIFAAQVHGHMQQRARRRQPQPIAQTLRQRLEPIQQRGQIALPHVAPADHAQRQHAMRGQQAQKRLHVFAARHGIHMQPGHGQVGGQIAVVAQRAKVARQQQLGAAVFEMVIRGVEGVPPGFVQIRHQQRLVNLHPFRARFGQAFQQLGIHRQQARQQRQAVAAVVRLAQRQIGHGADDDGPRLHALRLGFGQLRQQARGIQRKRGARVQLRHDVVVVGVKPLGHFTCGHFTFLRAFLRAMRMAACGMALMRASVCARIARATPGHAKQLLQRRACVAPRTLGHVAQREAHVQHVVIKREVAHGRPVQPGLPGPVLAAQRSARGLQLRQIALAAPVRLQREFQFALCAHARKTQVVNRCHDEKNPLKTERKRHSEDVTP